MDKNTGLKHMTVLIVEDQALMNKCVPGVDGIELTSRLAAVTGVIGMIATMHTATSS